MTNAIGHQASVGGSPEDASAGLLARSDTGSPGTIAAVASIVRPVVRSMTHVVADLIARIVRGIQCMAPLVVGLGCESTSEVANVANVAPAAREPAPAPIAEQARDTGPRLLGQFTVTFYYVVGEDEVESSSARVAANDNRGSNGSGGAELTAIAPDLVTLYAGGGRHKCEPIAEVSRDFASQLVLQGTGKLHDGRVVNIWGACNCENSPCFMVTRAQWGMAGNGKPLQPFRTVAVDPKVIKLGSLLHVPLLEGRTMPGRKPWGGYVHDGCVIADDTGGNIIGNRLDLFVGRKAYFLGMSGSGGRHSWARDVRVFDGSRICERNGRRIARKAASI